MEERFHSVIRLRDLPTLTSENGVFMGPSMKLEKNKRKYCAIRLVMTGIGMRHVDKVHPLYIYNPLH
jgi:hypothetical protein